MDALQELRELVIRHAGEGAFAMARNEALGVRFVVTRRPREPVPHVYDPVVSLVVEGEKRAMLGTKLFTCRTGEFMVASVDLPLTIHVPTATSARPFVAMAMALDPAKVAALLLESAASDARPEAAGLGLSNATPELVEALLRLVRLIDHPRDLQVLGPLAEREILWRLLCSEQGQRVRQIGLADSRLSQIGRAMRFIREHYTRALSIEDLARVAAMSVTSFHRHFRAVALMSPLRYIKLIRLQQARARLLAGTEDVMTIGMAVGYESPSQFSREYKRAYGSPPGQDARLLRNQAERAAAGEAAVP
jgi:AraC-like DNA-binding protein